MRALRLALGYFVTFRLQRVLVPLGAALSGIGVFTSLVSGQGRSLISIGFALAVAPVVPFAATTFREISIRHTTSLAPHARVTLLASLLIVVGLVVGGWQGLLVAGVIRGIIEPDLYTSVVVPFTFVTAALLGLIVASTSPVALVVVFASAGGLFYWLRQGGYETFTASGIDPVAIGAVTAVLAWLAFGYAYLTTRRPGRVLGAIEPMPRWHDSPALTDLPQTTPAAAVQATLSGMPVVRDRWKGASAAAIGMALVVGVSWLLSALLPRGAGPAALFGIASPLFVVGTSAAQCSRRARALWLVRGASREDIFRICERRLLRHLGMLALVLTLVILAWTPEWLLEILGPAGIGWLMLLGVSGLFFSTYLGLMHIEGWRLPDILLAIALVASIYTAPFAAQRAAQAPLLAAGLVAAQVAAGLICRWMAVRRWRRIDWTRLRPLRWFGPPSPRVRYGG